MDELFNFTSSDYIFAAHIGLSIVGTVGNTLVVLTIIGVKFLHTYTNFLIAHQAVADALVCVSNLIFHFRYVPVTLINSATCILFYHRISFYIFALASSFSLLCLNVERYIAIVHPLHYPNYVTNARVAQALVAIWTISLLLALVVGLTSVYYDAELNQCATAESDVFMQVVQVATGGFALIVNLVGIVVPYTQILASINSSAQRQRANGMAVDGLLQARRQVINVLMFVAAAYCITWIPVNIIYALLSFNVIVDPLFYDLSEVVILCNSVVNPFIYAFKYKEFRRGFHRLFSCTGRQGRVHPIRY
ncbi:galanin receptor 2b-like [Patiria miniata]|uniref:G-protein coupled receptors family 1 profile domain-containing protein n=1 Tax=Patiria miniata TaxID=46514 RepID=A0A914B5G2_PATMI|nr:galanin receptor 2b-like [Patiria miniata]